ncbi:hypothetical protein GCM10009759_80000 [Kitasatospora saccharophila]|uniref:Uncharacterized protein n=1 Tax=Kitasatospora saccharophila TaxID=407973 RepID=A0ABP5KDI8_9ACTN
MESSYIGTYWASTASNRFSPKRGQGVQIRDLRTIGCGVSRAPNMVP